MENETSELKSYQLGFNGKGKEFFGITVINWLLNTITLGFYSSWAKAKTLGYLYGSTTLNDDNFSFHGTGKEMFKGFIKLVLIFLVLFITCGSLIYYDMVALGLFILYFSLIVLTPIIIHGSIRYQLSRSSWRGIRFGYRGNRNELIGNYFKWVFFSIISLGVYAFWMLMNLYKYIIENIRLGDIEFKFKGKGLSYFLLGLKGILLTIITLGVYYPWLVKSIFEYFVSNLSAYRNAKEIKFKSTLTAGNMFNLIFVNYLILVFTLGLGYAWVVTRSMTLIASKLELEGDIDLDNIQQTEADYTSEDEEESTDFLNIDYIF
jgi:Predicted membrane protein